ncbi:hypothetical protein lbkm_2323 [Lachnospiraceae bacterium KM106-2]|nr:hypothetical protein lbkm_2323 [Lachnospiraceae bacterium KM106-2]
MNGIVVYKSNTGFTKRYADWIAEELGINAVPIRKVSKSELRSKDVIIFGGCLLAGKISGLSKIKKLAGDSKKLIVFTTGLTPMVAKKFVEKVKEDNITKEDEERISFYYFAGGVDYDKLKGIYRFILKRFYKSLKKDIEKKPENEMMMKVLEESADYTNKDYIKPLIDKVKA